MRNNRGLDTVLDPDGSPSVPGTRVPGAPEAGAEAASCLSQLVEACAARLPDAPALRFGAGLWSLGTINTRANRLARHLRAAGVGPETIVAVCLPRGVELWIALLAVLKAGGAYLPLDPATPPERIRFVLGDAQAKLVVARRDLAGSLPAALRSHVVCPWADAPRIAAHDGTDPRYPLAAHDLAYVIYTSGSTGRPKGVLVERANLLAEMRWELAALEITQHDRILMRTPVSFDGASLGLWAPLLAGALGVMLDEDGLRDPRVILETIRRERITVVTAIPSLLAAILDELEAEPGPLPVRAMIAGGEVLPAALTRRWARLAEGALYNFYGPTECTVNSLFHRCAKDGEPGVVPLGRPTDGTTVRLLDDARQPVPDGAVGEIWIGGAGVARGYLDRPGLTAERFVADPAAPGTGARLYRTGDLGRRRADGLLEFAGRADAQVKFRGYRIELAEIESVLAESAQVSHAATGLVEHPVAGTQLVAWVSWAPGRSPDPAALRAELARSLPDYMIPAVFVDTPVLPRLPSGKVDRQALARSGAVGAPLDADHATAPGTPPESPSERRVAALWAEVLGVSVTRREDDFFALGGHSMLAARVNARLRARYGISLPLRAHFDAPTVAALAARIDAVPEHGADAGGPRAGDPAAPAPATAAQAALLFVESLDEPGPRYNVTMTTALRGPLQVDALCRAVRETLAHHRVLRTRFFLREGVAWQQVDDAALPALEVLDLATAGTRPGAGDRPEGAEAEEPQALARRLLDEHARVPFDPARPPLARALLLGVGAQHHVLQLVVHHLVVDGWSMALLGDEIGERYRVLASGGTPVVPPLALEFADHARWVAAAATGAGDADALARWRERLAGVEPLDLPPASVPPQATDPAGGSIEFTLAPELLDAVQALADRHGATRFVVLLAAFQFLLAQVSGQRDLAVGIPVAGRERIEVEPLVGYFVNMLAVRLAPMDDERVDGFVRATRERVVAALDDRTVPFDQVVAALGLPREASRNPVFQASFALQERSVDVLALEGLECSALPLESSTPRFALSLSLVRSGASLQGRLEHAREHFDAAAARRLSRCYEQVLRSMAAAPAARLDALTLVEPRELAAIAAWNDTARPYPADSTLAARFACMAQARPQALAIVDGERRLVYRELDEQSNRLAHRLQALGAGPDRRVGVALSRSLEFVVAVLAIAKAGAAYLPLDSSSPPERLRAMIDDAAPVAFVGTSATLGESGLAAAPSAIALDRDAAALAAGPAVPPTSSAHAGSLAYVIYTSGSTGRPKGVMATQRGVLRLVCGTDYFQPRPDECIGFASNVSFDAATFEIWGALANGATLAVVGREALLSAPDLRASIARDRITTLFVTTALFNALAGAEPDVFSGLALLMFGGEAAQPGAVRAVARAGGPARLLNVYGPTETTTFATWHEVDQRAVRDADPLRLRIPIGRPLANTSCHVLDAALRPVPLGFVGELCIGGPGVAAGYLGQPELTAERFVPDPDPAAAGGRLYRTGDRVRWREDGELEFLGRADAQLKLRGFRIEPGEIEHVVRACPGVAEAAVLFEADDAGGGRLLAFATGLGTDETDRLVAWLRERLPAWMMPHQCVVLPRLPLTPNGKLDRRALSAHARAVRAGSGAAEAGPPDATTTRMLAIWREMLGAPQLGPDEDFFDAGGHSILAVRLVAEIERVFAVRLRTARLFDAPTARKLSGLVDALRAGSGATPGTSSVVVVQKGGDRPALVFLSGYGSAVIVFSALARALGPEQPLYVLDVGAFPAAELRAASLPEIVARMRIELRAACPRGPYALAGYSLGGKFAWEMARQLREEGVRVDLLCLLDCFAPGYPPRRSRAERLGLLVRELARSGPLRLAARVGTHLRWLRESRWGQRDESIFTAQAQAELGDSAIARDMQEQASAALALWRSHRPGPATTGRLALIVSAERDRHLAYVDEDPLLGWSAFVPEGIDRYVMSCHHRQMLEPEHAPELAALLGPLLEAIARRP